jgi:hypothetical protein
MFVVTENKSETMSAPVVKDDRIIFRSNKSGSKLAASMSLREFDELAGLVDRFRTHGRRLVMGNLEPEQQTHAWGACMWPLDPPSDVQGVLRGSPRLHWSSDAAKAEARGWLRNGAKIEWNQGGQGSFLGRTDNRILTVHSILLPLDTGEA